jgi:hypothetical protein
MCVQEVHTYNNILKISKTMLFNSVYIVISSLTSKYSGTVADLVCRLHLHREWLTGDNIRLALLRNLTKLHLLLPIRDFYPSN